MAADEGQMPYNLSYHFDTALFHARLMNISQRCDLVDRIIEMNKQDIERLRLDNSIDTIIDWMET